ncbi:MAG: hypothetical protein DRR19_08055 [Candidatus Parabeggiatoa sp. nov. 1]|nr:MAG: hypothetical protein DRR19_08055 [Gammaproteobacteria bacterium]
MGISFYQFYPFIPTEPKTPPITSELPETRPQLPDTTPALPDTTPPALPAQAPELPKEISEPPRQVSTLWTIILLLPLTVLLLWHLWNIGRRYWARLYLTRKFTSIQPNIQKLFVKAKELEKAIFQPLNLSRTAQQLRKHVPMPANTLDIVATLDKTIKAGGWLMPVCGTTLRRPEYLVLIDRTTFKDHQAALVNTLINQLVAEEVLVTRYYFEGNPRRCYPEPDHLAPLTLTELADRYPSYRLMIFSDGSGFINPVTGELVRWIEQFAIWSHRILFMLETPEQWGYRKQLLEAADFLVLPVNEAGLKFLVEWVNANIWQSYPELSESLSGYFPTYLREYPRRWLEHHAPEPAEIVELLRQVWFFLGKDGYYWFSACAVYPELHWQLTLYLGNQLTSDDSQKLLRAENIDGDEAEEKDSQKLLRAENIDGDKAEEKILVKLASLPWFRYGYMPVWLRERVIADLVPHKYMPNWLHERLVADLVAHKQYKEIYAALNALIPADKSSEQFEQPVATGQPKPFTEETPLTEPLNESMFVTFMADKLAVKLPPKLRGLVIELSNLFKMPAISMRTVGAVIAVCLLVAILGLTTFLGQKHYFEEQQQLAEQALEEKRQAEQVRLAKAEAKLRYEQARLAKIEAKLKAEQERLAQEVKRKRKVEEQKAANIFEKPIIRKEIIRKGIVRIKVWDKERGIRKEGAGLIVGVYPNKAYIITLSHIIESYEPHSKIEIVIEFFGNKEFKAKVLAAESSENWFSDGEIPADAISLYVRKETELNLGDAVFTFGFPRGGARWTYDALYYSGQRNRNLVFSGSGINEGNSGSPLIKENQVVGMVSSMANQHILAITAPSIREFLHGVKGGKEVLDNMEKGGTCCNIHIYNANSKSHCD